MRHADSSEGRIPDPGFAADLVRSMRCGLITVDPEGVVLSVNDQAAAILEVDRHDSVGMPARGALRRHPSLGRLLAGAHELKTLPDRAEMEIRTRSGEARILGFSMSRVLSGEGQCRGTAFTFKDLTPIEQQTQQQQLGERLAALGAMAASLAHEIRNPLAALEVTTTLLRRRLDRQGKDMELMETLQEQVRRLSRTVNDALEYVRPLELSRAPADLADILNAAVADAAPDETARQVRVVRRYAPARLPVRVDPVRLRQALLNVVRNALEAMRGHSGVLSLEVDMPATGPDLGPGALAHIRIRDTGPGIPEEIRNKIFNPFFSTKTNGSGLGLAWTRKVVDAHDGVLDVDSRPGEGTTFTIGLPVPIAAATSDRITPGDALHEAQDSCRRG